jgi:hypothetical protein
VAELVETGELIPVAAEGARHQCYAGHLAVSPAAVEARALLSPFDSLIWDRARTLRLSGFHYLIGIYTPASLGGPSTGAGGSPVRVAVGVGGGRQGSTGGAVRAGRTRSAGNGAPGEVC